MLVLPAMPPRPHAWRRALLVLALFSLRAFDAGAAQQPVTEQEAVQAALRELPRLAAAHADSAAARAALRSAAEYPNPGLALEYTKDSPNYHLEVEQALEYPWVRSPRIQAARSALRASSLRVELTRARIRYDVLAAYAAAASARQIVTLSGQQAAHGAELLRIAGARRAAGDASDLDVDLARVNAAALSSALLADSLQLVTATLELQAAMGLPVDAVRVVAVDTLPAEFAVPGDSALAVAASEAEQRAADRRLAEQRRGRLPVPALRVGVEQGNPAGETSALLPTVGVSIPLPLFNRNGGGVAAARAAADRAAAELAQARLDASLAVAVAERERALARARLTADRTALVSAQRVALLSLSAYREGAFPLAAVLDAQRSAWATARQVVEDIAALRTADAAVALARFGGVRP